MAVTPSDTAIRQLSRLVAADIDPKLSNADLTDALVMYARNYGSIAPGIGGWVETYDLYGAAVECLRWKLARVAADVTFSSDGSAFQLKELTQNLEGLINRYNDMRSTGTVGVA